jgi:hypothetical protein
MRLHLPSRFELPQLTKVSSKHFQEVTLRWGIVQREKGLIMILHTLAARGLEPERLDCSRCRFFSLN